MCIDFFYDGVCCPNAEHSRPIIFRIKIFNYKQKNSHLKLIFNLKTFLNPYTTLLPLLIHFFSPLPPVRWARIINNEQTQQKTHGFQGLFFSVSFWLRHRDGIKILQTYKKQTVRPKKICLYAIRDYNLDWAPRNTIYIYTSTSKKCIIYCYVRCPIVSRLGIHLKRENRLYPNDFFPTN